MNIMLLQIAIKTNSFSDCKSLQIKRTKYLQVSHHKLKYVEQKLENIKKIAVVVENYKHTLK